MTISMIRGYVAPPGDGGAMYSGAGTFSEYGYLYVTQEGEASSEPDVAAFAPTEHWNGFANFGETGEFKMLLDAMLALGMINDPRTPDALVIKLFTDWAYARGYTPSKYGQKWDDYALEAIINEARMSRVGRVRMGPPVARASGVRTRYAEHEHPSINYQRPGGLDVPGPLGGCAGCSGSRLSELSTGQKGAIVGGLALAALAFFGSKRKRSTRRR